MLNEGVSNRLIRLINPVWQCLTKQTVTGIVAFSLSCSALANPVVDNIASGNVTIEQTSSTTTINQSSQRAIINWKSFNIGASEHTHFQQPAGGVALNRISPTMGASSIYGKLTATGQIILVNPAGIYFGPSAYVNVGGMIATTHNIRDVDFLSGQYHFSKVDPYSGAIVNEGTIIAAQHGLVALVAPGIINNGMIEANMGKVVLASGDAYTMSFDGNGLINFAVDVASTSRGVDRDGNELSDAVKNTGSIIADGGKVIISAKSAAGVVDHVINMEGVAQARSVGELNGEIILSAETDINNDNVIRMAGKLDASGKKAGEKGGDVTVTSKYILADNGTNIDVSGDLGGGKVRIGGNYLGQGPLPNATAVVTAENTSINADAITNGKGGHVILWSDDYTNVNTDITARGGQFGGDGGFIETSSKNVLNVGDIIVSTYSPMGATGLWLLDPRNVTISTGATAGGTFNGGSPTNTFTPTADNAVVNVTTLETNLGSTNVTVNTGSTGTQAGNITVSSQIDWSAGTALTLDPAAGGAVVLNASIIGTGSVSGLTILGNITLGGSFTLQATDVNVEGNITGSGTQTLTLHTTDWVNQSSNITGVISSSGTLSLIKQGTGSILLTGVSTYTGTTTISAGSLNPDFDAINNTSGITVSSGASLRLSNLSGSSQTFGNTNTITLNSIGDDGGGALQVEVNSSSDFYFIPNPIALNTASTIGFYGGGTLGMVTLSGIISGSGNLTLLSSASSNQSSVVLTADNTYTGTTTITDAPVWIKHNNALGSAAAGTTIGTTVNGASLILFNNITVAEPITMGTFSGTIRNASGSNFLTGSVTLAGTAVMNVDSGTLTISGVIGESGGAQSFQKFDIGTLVVSGDNTFTGGVTLDSGTLTVSHNNALGSGTLTCSSSLTAACGTLTAGSAGVSLSNAVTLADNLTLGGSNAFTLGGNISQSGTRSITKSGTSNVTLSGTNTFSGGVTLNGGTLTANINSALGTGTLTYQSGTLAAGTADINLANAISLQANFAVGGSTNFTLSGVISESGGARSLTKTGTSNLTLAGTSSFTGGVTLNGGTLTANASASLGTGTLTYQSGTLTAGTAGINLANAIALQGNLALGGSNDFTLSGNITEDATPRSLSKTGTSNLTLAGTSSFTGGVTLNGGTLTANASSSLGTGTLTYLSGTLAAGTAGINIANTIDLQGNFAIGGSNNFTLSGVISETGGARSFTKSGSSVLTLSGTNTYSGGTTINAGTLSISANANLGATPGAATPGNITIAGGTLQTTAGFTINSNRGLTLDTGGGTIQADTGTLIYSGLITGSTSLTKTGAGILRLGGNSTGFSGGVVLSAGTLNVAHNNSLGTGTLTYNAGTLTSNSSSIALPNNIALNAALIFGTSTTSDLTLNGEISGNFGLNLNGSRQLNLRAANSFTGPITVSNLSWLDIDADNRLGAVPGSPTAGMIVLDNGTLQTRGSFTINSNRGIELGSGGGTITLFNIPSGDEITYNGIIAGSGNLIAAWGGTLILGGANTYTGSTNIHSTTVLKISADNNLGTAPVSPTASHLIISDARLQTTASFELNANRGIEFGPLSPRIVTDTGTTLTYNGIITGTASPMQKYGTGTLILGGNNSFDSDIAVFEGILQANHANAFGITSNIIYNWNSDTTIAINNVTLNHQIELDGTGASGAGGALISIGSAGIGASGSVTLNANATIGGADTLTINAVIAGTGYNITKAGTSNLVLSGNNSYTGGTTLSAGTLSVGHNSALGTGTFTYTDGTLIANSAGITIGNTIDLQNNITIAGSNNFTISGAIGQTGGARGLTKSGSSILTLTNANTYTGTTAIDEGTLRLSGSGDLANTTNVILADTTDAILDLNGISQTIGRLSGGGTNGGNITLGAGTLTVTQGSDQTYGGIISGSGGFAKAGANALTLSNANTYTGTTTISAGTLKLSGSGDLADTTNVALADQSGAIFDLNGISQTIGTLSGGGTNGGNIALGAGTLTVTQGSDQTYDGVISGTGILNKAGASVLSLTRANTYSGGTILTAGTLNVSNDASMGTGDVTADGGGLSIATAGLTIANNILLNSSLALAGTNNFTLSGIISGAGDINKSGTSVVTLSGANTFAGAIDISGGGVTVSHAQGLGSTTGSTTINSGGTLTISGASLGSEAMTLNQGTLIGSGTATLGGAITLASNTSNSIQASGGTFTLGSINGGADLALQGSGAIIVSANMGDSTALTSLTTTVPVTVGGTINTVNNQTFGSSLGLAAHTTFTSDAGNISFNNTLNGAFDLTLSSGGTTTFAGIVGGSAALNSLSVNASSISISGGAITTVGGQTYNAIVTPSATTTFTTNSTGAATVAFNNGVSGSNNIAVSGDAAANNSLSVNSGGTQNWTISASNGGSLAGMSGYSGAFTFANMRNITGSSGNDSFTLDGGSIAGTIAGGAGTNTLTAANVANVWNITSENTGDVTGVNAFNSIHNLVGGNSGNNFIFANNASVSGSIDGGTLSPVQAYFNIFDFSAYSTPVRVNLVGGIFGGNVKNNANSTITTYSNVDKLIGNFALSNRIGLPSAADKSTTVVVTGTKQGYIGDPTYFLGFEVDMPATPVATTTNNENIASIVQQPVDNAASNAPVTVEPQWVAAATTLSSNIVDITSQAAESYDLDEDKLKINPYCTSGVN